MTNHYLKIILAIFCILSFWFLIFSFSEAADQINQDTSRIFTYPWSAAGGQGQNPAYLVSKFYQIALGLVGAAALGIILYGAILYTLSAGSPPKQSEARDWITGGIWGVVLLLSAYLILYTINPKLVDIGTTGEFLEGLIEEIPAATTTPGFISSVPSVLYYRWIEALPGTQCYNSSGLPRLPSGYYWANTNPSNCGIANAPPGLAIEGETIQSYSESLNVAICCAALPYHMAE